MAETRSRRLGVEDGWSPVDWAMRAAPGMSAPHAAQLDVVAAAGEDSRLDELTEAVSTGALSVPKAAQVTRFHREVAGLAEPEELAEITHHLVAGASGSTGLTERQLAVAIRRTGHLLKPDRDLDREDEAMRRHRALVKGPGPAGMTSYRLLLDPEGAAILDAAIDPLARPQRDDESGERDERTPATRRADALLTVIGRGVSSPGEQPKAAKSQLVVTVRLDQLMAGLRGSGITLGQEALSRPARSGDWPATPTWCPSCSAPAPRSSTWAAANGSCHPPSGSLPGCATAAAPTPAARSPRSGATPIMGDRGGKAATRACSTPRCCASGTTRSSTSASWCRASRPKVWRGTSSCPAPAPRHGWRGARAARGHASASRSVCRRRQWAAEASLSPGTGRCGATSCRSPW